MQDNLCPLVLAAHEAVRFGASMYKQQLCIYSVQFSKFDGVNCWGMPILQSHGLFLQREIGQDVLSNIMSAGSFVMINEA